MLYFAPYLPHMMFGRTATLARLVFLRSSSRTTIPRFRGYATEPLVLHETEPNGLAFVTLNNPQKRNALSEAMLNALKQTLRTIREDRSARVVVLRATGDVFSSGHDLKELQPISNPESPAIKQQQEDHQRIFSLCTEVMEGVRQLPQPVIAQVNGLATAAGLQLVASCDLVVCTARSTFATPGVKVGLFCTTPGVAVVRAMNSTKKTMEMLLTGEAITAHEALHYGLVNRVVESNAPEDLDKVTRELAGKILEYSSTVLALGKRAFYTQLEMDRTRAYMMAEQVMVGNLLEPDAKEGIGAFLAKRKPSWKRE